MNIVKFITTVVTLFIHENIKYLENLKQGFRRRISQNKYRSETTTKQKKNNLDYMNDPTFRNITRLFVLFVKNGDGDPTINPFDE